MLSSRVKSSSLNKLPTDIYAIMEMIFTGRKEYINL